MAAKLDLTDDSRMYLTEMRALTTDIDGNEIIVGLSLAESEFYADFNNKDWDRRLNHKAPSFSSDDRDRWLDLHRKHESARFQVLGAEHVLRTENPTRN